MITSIMCKYAAELTGSDAAKAAGIGVLGGITGLAVPVAQVYAPIVNEYSKQKKSLDAQHKAIYNQHADAVSLLKDKFQQTTMNDGTEEALQAIKNKYKDVPAGYLDENLFKLHPEAKAEMERAMAGRKAAWEAHEAAVSALDNVKAQSLLKLDDAWAAANAAYDRKKKDAAALIAKKLPKMVAAGAALPTAVYLARRKLSKD